MTEKQEELTSPKRYNQGNLEVWDAILGLNLGFLEGNVIKYICRHHHKGGRADLEKAKAYIDKIIDYYYQ